MKQTIIRASQKVKINPVKVTDGCTFLSRSQIDQSSHFFDRSKCIFKKSLVTKDQVLEYARQITRAQVAFFGRSNVGKSSLLSSLVLPIQKQSISKSLQPSVHKDVAHISKKAGHTKALNLYHVGNTLELIDLPGYGFGSTREQGDLIITYLMQTKRLRRAIVLLDASIGSIKEQDYQIFDLLNSHGIPWQVVLTKMDKAVRTPEKVPEILQEYWHSITSLNYTTFTECMIATSVNDKWSNLGIKELRASILSGLE